MADFYGTANGYTAYLTARGLTVDGDLTDADIETLLLVASEWLDGKYLTAFPGLKTGLRAQVREWPRNGVVDIYGYILASDVPPREIENATYEAAYREQQSFGSLTVDYTPGKYKAVSIDGALSVQYAERSAYDVQLQIPAVDGILAPILNGYGNSSSLSGCINRV
jgi:hypothetical protein